MTTIRSFSTRCGGAGARHGRTAVAREAGIHASPLYRRRQELCGPVRAAVGCAAVTVAAEPSVARSSALAPTGGLIEIEFASGARVRISGGVDAATISAAVAALTAGPN
jgi:transposase